MFWIGIVCLWIGSPIVLFGGVWIAASVILWILNGIYRAMQCSESFVAFLISRRKNKGDK